MKRTIITMWMAGATLLSSAQDAPLMPYQNPSLSFEERADDLLSRLTLEEKASLMRDSSPAIPRLGIPEWHWWSEALHGVGRNGTATVFPITMQMASTFDDVLVERIFTAVSDEGRAKNSIAKRAGRLDNNRCMSFWTLNIRACLIINVTVRAVFAGIFPPVLRSLWNPITPSSQAKTCSPTDRLDGNIYY